MAMLLERFMLLSYALHLMGVDIDIDESGLTVEQFEIIDQHFEGYLGQYDGESLKYELIEIVKMLSQIKPTEVTEDEQN